LAVLALSFVRVLSSSARSPISRFARACGRWSRRGRTEGDGDHRTGDAALDGEDEGFGRTPEGVVVLVGNLWEACEIDGLREPWSRFTARPTQGVGGVPCGRHRVRTRTPNGDAVLDFTMKAGAVLVRRLDVERALWMREDASTEADLQSRAQGGANGALGEALVSYRTAVGLARVAQGVVRIPDQVVDRAIRALAAELDLAASSDGAGDALRAANEIGAELVGLPLTDEQLARLWRPIALRAKAADAAGALDHAITITRVGLAALPEETHLVELLTLYEARAT
jgi:hypothetical protein